MSTYFLFKTSSHYPLSDNLIPFDLDASFIGNNSLWKTSSVTVFQNETRLIPIRKALLYSSRNSASVVIESRRSSAVLSNVALHDEQYWDSPSWKTFIADGCNHSCEKQDNFWRFSRHISYQTLAVTFSSVEAFGVFTQDSIKVLVCHEEIAWCDENLNKICSSLIF